MPLTLARAVKLLAKLHPLGFAEPWDNVGLLLGIDAEGAVASEGEGDGSAEPVVGRALFCIDLTEAVLDEALAERAELVVAYHPPIFKALKKLDGRTPSSRLLLRAARAGIAIYAPHTALDAAPGGINDWLCAGLGQGETAPLVDSPWVDPNAELKLVTFVPPEHAAPLREALSAAGAGVIGEYRECSTESRVTGTFLGSEASNPTLGERGRLETVAEARLEMVCPRSALGRIARVLRDVHPYEEPAWDVYPLAPRAVPGTGMGRSLELAEPASLETLVSRLKAHLGRESLRVAVSTAQRAGGTIRRIAVCAGSGKSIFEQAPGFDLYVTGELSHHDVLARLAGGASVILAEHSSSERGYLPRYAESVAERAEGALTTFVSVSDREPIETW